VVNHGALILRYKEPAVRWIKWFDPELHTVLTDLGQGAIYDNEL